LITTKDTESYDREFWTEIAGFSEFDYGLIVQYFYSIHSKILLTAEGYFGLSEFKSDNEMLTTGIPNVFHYVNVGLTYKL